VTMSCTLCLPGTAIVRHNPRVGRPLWLRIRVFLRLSRPAFAMMLAWVALGTVVFRTVLGLPFGDALQNALYLGRQRGWLWDLYSFWGQCILFGIVVSFVLLPAMQRFNPQEVSRMLSEQVRNHTIVVGYTHLGARLVEDLESRGDAFVLIEKDVTTVDHLVRAGKPVVVDNAKEVTTLESAGIRHARSIIVTSDNIETALLVTKRAREANRDVRIIVRCFQDDFVEILEGLGADDVISSSKSAFREVSDRLAAPTPSK
jgi:hypothetical protein